jgi:hypothetical protein
VKSTSRITVSSPDKDNLNGLGKMIIQYLEQNFEDFAYKTKQALGIHGRVVVEVEQGIAITISFEGERIRIMNGIGHGRTLQLAGRFSVFANVLSGKSNPLVEVFKGHIKIKSFLKRPIQSLKIFRFLKVPSEPFHNTISA